MSDFPSMHARDAAKLPHVSLDELSARVPREPALVIALKRAKVYDPAHFQVRGTRGGMDVDERKAYWREYQRKRRRTLGVSTKRGRPRKEMS